MAAPPAEGPQDEPQVPTEGPSYKLDLGYFTRPDLAPRMVRHRSRRCFELFLFLAHCSLDAGHRAICPGHEALCEVCGVDPDHRHSPSKISHALRRLSDTYGVIDYQPVRSRRPRLCLRPVDPTEAPSQPHQYVYFAEGWSGQKRAVFERVGRRAFAAEYMYWIAAYESALAGAKHGRPYWFYPVERISQTFHVSAPFAGSGLQALVDLGMMRVAYGRRDVAAVSGEFGRANRYYFEGFEGWHRRQAQLEDLKRRYQDVFRPACELAGELHNGTTAKNVEGLCQWIGSVGEGPVREAVGRLAGYRRGNPRRRLEYVASVLSGKPSEQGNREP